VTDEAGAALSARNAMLRVRLMFGVGRRPRMARARLWQRGTLVAVALPVVFVTWLGILVSRPIGCGGVPCVPDEAGSWVATAEWAVLLTAAVAAVGLGIVGHVRPGAVVLGITVCVAVLRLLV
jgi:hypothetical protein